MDEYLTMVRTSAADAANIARTRAAGKGPARRGAFALMLVIIVIGAAFVLGMGYLCSASVRLASSSNYVALARSRAAAESGLEHALYVLCSAPGTAATYTQSSPAGPYMLEGNVVYRFYFAAGSGTNNLYTPVGIGNCGKAASSLSATLRVSNKYADSIMAFSPLSYWRLGETSGTLAQDQKGVHSGWYLNGVSKGNASPLIGATAASAWFDGLNDCVDVGNFSLSGSAITIVAWVKPDSGSLDNRYIVCKPDSGVSSNNCWALGALNVSGQNLAFFRVRATIGSATTTSGAELVAGRWTFLAGVYDGAMMVLYQDGVEVSRTAMSGNIQTRTTEVWIGGNAAGSALNRWKGYVCEVAVCQTALSAAQVQALYQARNPAMTILNWNE